MEWESILLTRLHDKVGICGHCHKRKCLERKANSTLPMNIKTAVLLNAIGETKEELQRRKRR